MKQSYDIIVVGGGVVGLTLALTLAKQTALSIAIVEAKTADNSWQKEHYHHRVSAITLTSKRILQSLSVWDFLQQKRVSSFTQISVWDDLLGREINFNSQEIAEANLGFIIENNLLQLALQEKIKSYAHIKFIAPLVLQDIKISSDQIELLSDDIMFTAKLAIAADGANSWLRDKAGIEVDKKDYVESAIVATVQTALPHQKIARQLFKEKSVLAFLPLAEDYLSSIVWSLPQNEAERLLALTDEIFQDELAHAFGRRLGKIIKTEKRFSLPLYKQQAKNYVKARIALVGDAAHTVHPLAGQGVNLGLLDAVSLADVITQAYRKHRDIASLATLRKYERWRKADNLAMCVGIDTLKSFFATKKKSLQTLRAFGLDITQQMRWFKNIFTRHAVGERTCLPEFICDSQNSS